MADKIELYQRLYLDGKGCATAVLGETLIEPMGMEMLHRTFGTYDGWTARHVAMANVAAMEKIKTDVAHNQWEQNPNKRNTSEPKLNPIYAAELKLLESALDSHSQNRQEMITMLTAGQLLDYNSVGGNPIVNIPQNLLDAIKNESGKKYSDLSTEKPKLTQALDAVDFSKIGILHKAATDRWAEGRLALIASTL